MLFERIGDFMSLELQLVLILFYEKRQLISIFQHVHLKLLSNSAFIVTVKMLRVISLYLYSNMFEVQ